MKKISCLIVAALAYPLLTDACTTILVDSAATTDGSRIIARNEDHSPLPSKILVIHPARNTKGKIFKSNMNQFTYPLPAAAFKYSSISDGRENQTITQLTFGAAGFNEKGVGMTSTETIYASPAALKHDPYLPDTGITEDSIVNVILPYATSARDGVLRLGKIVEKQGAGEGFGVAFVDNNEIWYFETGSAHQWLATKLPKGDYFVTGNQGRLRRFDPKDTANYLASPTLITYAIHHHLYDPAKDGKFNFEKAYTQHTANDGYYNYPRVYALQKMYNPDNAERISEPATFPVFMKPEHKLTLADVKKGLRNTYENLNRKPYVYPPDTTYRPISVFRTQESHILQTRPNLPAELASVKYVAYGMPSISLYIPIYENGIDQIPYEFSVVTDEKADNISAQWRFRKLQTLVMNDYYKYSPVVQKAFAAQEAKFDKMQREMEHKYLAIYKTNPVAAHQLIQKFQNKVFTDALTLVDSLNNQLFTKMAIDLNSIYEFKGA